MVDQKRQEEYLSRRTEDEVMDIMDLEWTTAAEVNAQLIEGWRFQQPLYNLYAQSLMLDYAPSFAKAMQWSADLYGVTPDKTLMLAVQNMHSYMVQGWETGILNTFHTLTRNGLNKQQIMEIVMFSNLYAGMRGLGHVYRAAGDLLAVLMPPPVAPPYPAGWAPDPAAFKSGLDMTTRGLTSGDEKNLTAWYEKTLGFLPNSIKFGIKYHPEFIKANRAKWEVALRTVPKQFAPYQMLRHHTTNGDRNGLREAVLLAQAWGISRDWIIIGITGTAYYFTCFEGLYAAHDAVSDLL